MRGIFLGLGSNCGDCLRLIRDAVVLLEERGVVVMVKSGVYETEPVLEKAGTGAVQANYLNAVVEVETDLSPDALLRVCMEVEQALGRVREVRWGARTMDIDVLMYGDRIMSEPDLVVPHPRMHERNFVLVPFAEIGEEVIHPVLGKTIRELLNTSEDRHGVFPSEQKF